MKMLPELQPVPPVKPLAPPTWPVTPVTLLPTPSKPSRTPPCPLRPPSPPPRKAIGSTDAFRKIFGHWCFRPEGPRSDGYSDPPRYVRQSLGGHSIWSMLRCLLEVSTSVLTLSLIHISEPTRLGMISYAVFCLKKKKQ